MPHTSDELSNYACESIHVAILRPEMRIACEAYASEDEILAI